MYPQHSGLEERENIGGFTAPPSCRPAWQPQEDVWDLIKQLSLFQKRKTNT